MRTHTSPPPRAQYSVMYLTLLYPNNHLVRWVCRRERERLKVTQSAPWLCRVSLLPPYVGSVFSSCFSFQCFLVTLEVTHSWLKYKANCFTSNWTILFSGVECVSVYTHLDHSKNKTFHCRWSSYPPQPSRCWWWWLGWWWHQPGRRGEQSRCPATARPKDAQGSMHLPVLQRQRRKVRLCRHSPLQIKSALWCKNPQAWRGWVGSRVLGLLFKFRTTANPFQKPL